MKQVSNSWTRGQDACQLRDVWLKEREEVILPTTARVGDQALADLRMVVCCFWGVWVINREGGRDERK